MKLVGELGAQVLTTKSDSQLVSSQVNGDYRPRTSRTKSDNTLLKIHTPCPKGAKRMDIPVV
ncbi:hypothetical protein CR513_61558, partial [Mucuna pruriens]